jgi:uncharacterized protein (DUF2252 family)
MTESSLIHRIKAYNKGRVPAYLAMKYAAMRESPFRFLRGSAHLFYEDIPKDSPLLQAPKAWICGDLHLENLGSFKGDNGLAYFDLNDFDEAALAPCLLDITRFACSIYIGADELSLDAKAASAQVVHLLDKYIANLRKGYIRVLEQETATGVMKQFLKIVQTRNRKLFLSGRVEVRKEKPQLVTGNGRYFKLDAAQKQRITEAFHQTPLYQSDPAFFAVRDVAFRVAGTGSLGMERYVLLVEGKKGVNRFYLIDVKEAQTPSLLLRHHFRQPVWPSQADRIVEIQKRLQAVPPARLSTMDMGAKSFVVKELQPMEDKLNLTHLQGRAKRCQQFIGTVGDLSAWSMLRSSGRQGSAIADDLIAFAEKSDGWRKYVGDYAAKYAGKVSRDFTHFQKAYDKGAFKDNR